MNDTELDEMLDQWAAPPAPASLREKARAGFQAERTRIVPADLRKDWRPVFRNGIRKTLLAAAIAGVGAFLVMVTTALSQTAPPEKIPYTVESEFIRYGDDGSRAVEMYLTSYMNQNGGEALVSRSIPGHPFETALGRTLDATLPAWSRLILPAVVSRQDLERMKKSRPPAIGFITGCPEGTCLTINRYFFRRAASGADGECLEGPVVGRETILNYPTTAVELHLGEQQKMTFWTAPALGCFALRITSDTREADGVFHLTTVKQALKVTVSQ
jgi:hypothetical protein